MGLTITGHLTTKPLEKKEFIPYEIEGYKINAPLTSNKSGFSKWGICEKNGRKYFIKEFITPVYPADDIDLSDEVKNSKIKQCTEWFEERKKVYKEVIHSQSGNLVVPLKFFKHNSHFYIITENIDKCNLSFEDIYNSSLEQKEIILKVLANSFAKLAENKVVHADIKPDNFMIKKTVQNYFTIKIIDFDSSYIESNSPFGDEIQGDFVYYSPETFLALCEEEVELTPKVDVFALGIIFHQILSGKMPEFSDEYLYVYEAVLNDDNVKLCEDINLFYRQLIEKMLKKDAKERISMSEVLSELCNFNSQDIMENNSSHENNIEIHTNETLNILQEKSINDQDNKDHEILSENETKKLRWKF